VTRKAAQEADKGTRLPTLIVLTGASHTGKTSVASAILDSAQPPVAFLSVDKVLGEQLRPRGEIWELIPLAYELLRPQVETLLRREWLVIYESTFTYVPKAGSPEFHRDALSRLASACARTGARLLIVQLSVDDPVALSRRDATQRLPAAVVTHTAALHRKASMPKGTLRLNSGTASPGELALKILEELSRSPSA
jgi:chloramphenicol 3-O-phosphotransferase